MVAWNATLVLSDMVTLTPRPETQQQTLVIDGGRTILTVAHRLATAQEADRVLVMEAGEIVEAGPPQELIRQGGRFAALLELEAAGWDWQTDGRAFRA